MGDDLWDNFRPDVAVAGLGSVVDVTPAGAGALEIVLGRAGLAGPCWASLYALSRRKSEPGVYIAKTGYDPALWRRMGNLAVHQGRGLVGRLEPDWRFEESWTATQRLLKSYSLRGLAYARSGGIFDPECPRDEMALDGLMFYADSLVSFGVQSRHYGPEGMAIQAYRQAAKLLEPFAGRIERPASLPGLDRKQESRMWAWALADGYDRLAARFEGCGAISRAETYRLTAEMCRL